MIRESFIEESKYIHKLSTHGVAASVLELMFRSDLEYYLELWKSQGVGLLKKSNTYYFATKFTQIKDASFCIVDIETNGSKIEKHQIIEIAALKIKNGAIVDRFESFVFCEEINPNITAITGISQEDTADAPKLKEVMYDFRTFLGDAVFVAHDVKFDFKFISLSMQKVGLPPLLNRSICSIDLAERTIVSYRYALSYLNKLLDLHKDAKHHRAMSDVITTSELFFMCLEKIDKTITKSVEDLVKFSKEWPRLKRPKFDPFLFDAVE